MTKITYVFGDLRTGQVRDELPLYGVSMSRALNKGGELRATFNLDTTGRSNTDLVGSTLPGKSYIVVEREGIPIWGGIVWSQTYQSQAKVMTIYCAGFESYPEVRVIRQNYPAAFDDQGTIFRTLWNDMQAITNGSILVEVPSSFLTGVVKDLEVLASERKTYAQVMSSFADGDNGFDWTIDVVRDGGVYRRIMRLGYPQLGALMPTAQVVEYPGSVINYWATNSMVDAGTHIDILGAGEGADMLVAQTVHTDLLASGWAVFDREVSYKHVVTQSVLSDIAVREGRNRKAPVLTIKTEIKGDRDSVFGSYGLGDYMHVVISDARFPNLSQYKRLIGWEYWPPSDENTEHAILAFEGAGEDV